MDAVVKTVGSLSTGCLAVLTVESITRGDYMVSWILGSCAILLLLITLSLDWGD